ncbi:hypothetical protein D3C84_1181710 [compost metagenome]
MLAVHGHLDHLGFHGRAQRLGVALEELVEQVDVLLRDQAVGGTGGFLQAAGDLAQVDGGHGGRGFIQ